MCHTTMSRCLRVGQVTLHWAFSGMWRGFQLLGMVYLRIADMLCTIALHKRVESPRTGASLCAYPSSFLAVRV